MAIARLIIRKLVCIQGKDTAFQFRQRPAKPPAQATHRAGRKLSAVTSLLLAAKK